MNKFPVKVIEAGSIPLTWWSEPDGRWKVVRSRAEETPPRVLLEVSEEVARVLASHVFRDIEIAIIATDEGGPT